MNIAFLLSYAALWLLVGVETLVLLGLIHAVHGRERGAGAGTTARGFSEMLGSPLPQFQAVDQHGSGIESSQFRGRPTVLLYVSPTCRECAAVLDDMTPLMSRGEQLVVLCRGQLSECRELASRHDLNVPVLADPYQEIGALLRLDAVPTAIEIDAEGRIRSYGRPEEKKEAPSQIASPASNRRP